MFVPTVIDRTEKGECSYDIYSRLLEDRIIFITGEINDAVANTVIAQMLYLESKSKAPINLYINSPGGVSQAGLAILDTMQFVKCPVSTICLGLCASAAALLLAGGQPQKRFALPNSKIMIHQPWGAVQGQITEIEIYYKEGKKDRQKYAELLSRFCKKSQNEIDRDIERDNYLSAEEALKYGIIDEILTPKKSTKMEVK